MADLIDRKKLLDAIENDGSTQYPHWWYVDKIKAMPTAEKKWVPCGERYPNESEEGKIFIVTAKTKSVDGCDVYGVTIACWSGSCWFFTESPIWIDSEDVVAWMPLPEPYQEEKNG